MIPFHHKQKMTKQFIPSPSQQRAICHKDGPLLVLAGPGSGKTAVMIHRLQHLIEAHQVPPEQILAISFTKASAKELAERFHKLTQNAYPQLVIRTFHSLFYAILRHTYGDFLPRPVQAQTILQALIGNYPDMPWAKVPAKELARLLSEIKNGIYHEEIDPLGDKEQLAFLYTAYEKELRQTGQMDLDDLLLRTKELFVTAPAVRALWQQQFSYILIDEFQDISPLQFEIISMLAAPQNHLFAVGDDDQAIYRFRGADAGFMLDFERHFPGADIQLLETNFRCPDTVVEASMRLIAHNKIRYQKQFVSVKKDGLPICVKKLSSPKEEAAFVAAKAKNRLQKEHDGTAFAVLARNRRQLKPLCEAFADARIPYNVPGGICLTTMHGAKGLEFDEVYILDVNEGFTPYARGGIVINAEEERRLFYVAVTRAKKSLSLLVLENEQEGYRPSRFLREMRIRQQR